MKLLNCKTCGQAPEVLADGVIVCFKCGLFVFVFGNPYNPIDTAQELRDAVERWNEEYGRNEEFDDRSCVYP